MRTNVYRYIGTKRPRIRLSKSARQYLSVTGYEKSWPNINMRCCSKHGLLAGYFYSDFASVIFTERQAGLVFNLSNLHIKVS